jgi:hypothetical protein
MKIIMIFQSIQETQGDHIVDVIAFILKVRRIKSFLWVNSLILKRQNYVQVHNSDALHSFDYNDWLAVSAFITAYDC